VKIQVLGTGCPKCRKLEKLAREAADSLGLEYTLQKVDDVGDIVAMGVMNTPALAVDGEVVLAGRVPSAKEIEKLLADAGS